MRGAGRPCNPGRGRAAAAPAPGTARGSPSTERPARPEQGWCSYPRKARRGSAGPGLGAAPSLRHGRAVLRPPRTGPGRGPCSPHGARAGAGSGAPPHPHLHAASAGTQPGSGGAPGRSPAPGPAAHAAEIPSKAITKPVGGRKRGFVFDSLTGSFSHPALRNKNPKTFFSLNKKKEGGKRGIKIRKRVRSVLNN